MTRPTGDEVAGAFCGLAFAGMCYAGYLMAPATIFVSVPLLLAAFIVILSLRKEEP